MWSHGSRTLNSVVIILFWSNTDCQQTLDMAANFRLLFAVALSNPAATRSEGKVYIQATVQVYRRAMVGRTMTRDAANFDARRRLPRWRRSSRRRLTVRQRRALPYPAHQCAFTQRWRALVRRFIDVRCLCEQLHGVTLYDQPRTSKSNSGLTWTDVRFRYLWERPIYRKLPWPEGRSAATTALTPLQSAVSNPPRQV